MNRHYMQKDEGEIVAIPLNEWAKYRANGYKFSTEKAFNEQELAKPEPAKDEAPEPIKRTKKKMRRRQRG